MENEQPRAALLHNEIVSPDEPAANGDYVKVYIWRKGPGRPVGHVSMRFFHENNEPFADNDYVSIWPGQQPSSYVRSVPARFLKNVQEDIAQEEGALPDEIFMLKKLNVSAMHQAFKDKRKSNLRWTLRGTGLYRSSDESNCCFAMELIKKGETPDFLGNLPDFSSQTRQVRNLTGQVYMGRAGYVEYSKKFFPSFFLLTFLAGAGAAAYFFQKFLKQYLSQGDELGRTIALGAVIGLSLLGALFCFYKLCCTGQTLATASLAGIAPDDVSGVMTEYAQKFGHVDNITAEERTLLQPSAFAANPAQDASSNPVFEV